MPDEENTQPIPEPTTPPENPTPNQSSQSSDDTEQVSEPNPAPVSPDEPTTEAPVPTIESVPAPEPHGPTEAITSPESTVLDKDQNPANEPLEPAPVPEGTSAPENPNITVEKHRNDVTITEVMKPEPEEKTETAQMAGNEPLADQQAEKRKENLKLANEKRQEKKREKIDEIMTLFSENKEITNDEVEKLLHVSDATTTRYLETLEKEGKIRQVGKTGKGVVYEKI